MLAPEATAHAFHRACERAGVTYVLVGGLAVGAWGLPRATAYVDVIAVWTAAQVDAFAAALAREGLEVVAADLRDSLADRSHVTITDPRTHYHADLKPARSPDERRHAAEARTLEMPGGTLRVATAEYTVAYKLLYGTPQDIQDARSILVRQAGRLDTERLRRIAGTLGVGDALDALVGEMGD